MFNLVPSRVRLQDVQMQHTRTPHLGPRHRPCLARVRVPIDSDMCTVLNRMRVAMHCMYVLHTSTRSWDKSHHRLKSQDMSSLDRDHGVGFVC